MRPGIHQIGGEFGGALGDAIAGRLATGGFAMEQRTSQPVGQQQNAGQPTHRRVKNPATGEERDLTPQEWTANEARLRKEGFVPAEETDERLPVEKVPGGQGTPDGFSNGTTKVYR